MKRTLTLAVMLSVSLVHAQNFELIQSTNKIITVHHEFTEHMPSTRVHDSRTFWDLDNTYKITSKEVGAPALPMFSESVLVPNQGNITLAISHSGYTEYTNIDILPSKGSLKRNVNPENIPYTFGPSYSTDAFFPGVLADLSEPFNLRHTRGVTIQFSPIQYNPVTGVVRVYHDVQASVLINGKQVGINELEDVSTLNDPFSSVYAQQYLNAEAILGKYTPVEEEGEMLIIADASFMDEIQPLVDWKIQSGIRTTAVTTATTGTVDTDIKAYVTNFYASNPNLVFVLLVGDHGQVKSHTYGMSGGEQLWSDSYYGQLTGGTNDYYPELFVGRFSGTTSQHITTQVDRVLEYEKNPAAGDWMEKAIGLASNEGQGIGDDGEADWQHARNNRTDLMNFGYTTVYEFYDGSHGGEDASGSPSSSIILPAVNEGVGLFNYTGHGDINTCITGNFNSSNVNSATNNGKYPFVISVACNNGTFTSGTCISEAWAWATNAGMPTGAIAACGSSILMAWAEPMQTQDEMTKLIAETYANNRKATLGGLFYNGQMSVLEDYNNSTTAKEVMQTWVMFGDPSVLFRDKQTMVMDVSHIGNVPLGTSSIVVNCDTDGAMVTIVQNGEILGKALASGGSAIVNITALTSNQPLIVTGVKQNYRPYQGVITVADGPAGIDELLFNQLTMYPNPANEFVNLSWNSGLAVESVLLYDLSGKKLLEATLQGNGARIDTQELATGMYVVRVNAANTSKSYRLAVQ